MTIWIDNGKSPDEPYDAKLEFWLPPKFPVWELLRRIDGTLRAHR